MFSSLASFIFGSNTSATTQSETNQNPPTTLARQEEYPPSDDEAARIDAENTIEVTRSTPSVTGTLRNTIVNPQGKRGKNKRNRRQFKRQALEQQVKTTPPPSITKLLTPSESFEEEDIDEDDWFIVEKEDEDTSLPRTDSEEELSVVEVKPKLAAESNAAPAAESSFNNNNNNNNNPVLEQRRQLQHIHSHSLFSGPRPQQNRNLLQRARNSGARVGAFSVATLSPPRSISSSVSDAGVAAIVAPTGLADGGLTQSLYVVSTAASRQHEAGYASDSSDYGTGANVLMEESWFVTPPPCFTSIGPIHMETSPFENLLIEHPSMSVYHSIRSAQEATDSFVNLDLGVEESQQQAQQVARSQNGRNNQASQQRSTSARIDRYSAAQLKQELLARNGQKVHDKKERQNLCRGAIKRSNKVRDFQGNGKCQRRSDMQHCKINSGANNNRKCYF